jgi:LPXTG-motif cell wall-anchored protein
MNVPVPGEGTPLTFWLIIGAMALLLVGMVIYFRRRGWL